MLKEGSKVTITRMTYKQVHRKPEDLGDGAWITQKAGMETVKGVIGSLARLHLPLTLEDKSVRMILHENLKFLSGDRASFASKEPDYFKTIGKVTPTSKAVKVKGKVIRTVGKLFIADVHFPVLVNGDLQSIPYRELKSEKETK